MLQTGEGGKFSRIEGHLTGILRGFQYAGMSLVLAMMFLTVVNAVGRYALNKTVTGIIELSTFLLVMIIFLSIAYVQVKNGHVMVGLIVDRLSPRTQAIIDSVTYTIGLAVSILVVWQTLLKGFDIRQTGEVSLTLSIPFFPFYFVAAFGWAIFSLATLMNLAHFIYRAVKK